MKLHNTLTKKVEDFTPLDLTNVRVYSCGPTVYNYAHIGNLSSYIYFDILHRTLLLAGWDVQRVMNFTDVDDKTIRDSRLKYPDLDPMEALIKFTQHWESVFRHDMLAIGNLVDEIHFEHATSNIAEMQKLIQHLVDQKQAYVADDGVYFDIAEYRKTRVYGQLCHVELPSETKSRIDNDEYDKDTAADFALWKKQKDGEPAWDLEIDGRDLEGRPGWHIECSAMSKKTLGQPFDIHTGAVDNIFPHHENEIAQSTAGDQPEKLANFFIHSEHLLVDGKKMAKSEHNFYTVPDIEAKGFDPLDFRMLVLQSHYRNATNFTWESLTAAQNRRRNWRNIAELRWQITDSGDDGQVEIVNNLLDMAKERLLDDLDTPGALRYIDEAFSQFSIENLSQFAMENLLKFVDDNLSLKILDATPDISDEEKNLIAKRFSVRAEKDWAKSDEIRSQLVNRGVFLNDADQQTIWAR